MTETETLKETIKRIYDWQQHTNPIMVFMDAILDIEKLSNINPKEPYTNKYFQLLYANVITSLEAYLLDTFILVISKKEEFKLSLLSEIKEFKEDKYTLKDISSKEFNVDNIIRERLFNISWHNISKANSMYKSVLKIDFPPEKTEIYKAVNIRHDIVHRNGKDKTDNEIHISKTDLLNLKKNVESFVLSVNSSVLELVK
jgi:hypothetical protein